MPRRPLVALPLLISTLCALLVLEKAAHDPRYLLPFAVIAALIVLPPFFARRRMRQLLMSGDVKQVLGTWEPSIEQTLYPETMAPLITATAYAAYGWVDASRRALERAVRGPAWDAALEQRLFVETLLDTFEGERQAAMRKAEALELMPLPDAGPFVRRKVAMLRRGLAALARAFAHQSRPTDATRLKTAAAASPLIHWAMRYAGAVVAIDDGKQEQAKALLDGAPVWPEQSAFRLFHDELTSRLV